MYRYQTGFLSIEQKRELISRRLVFWSVLGGLERIKWVKDNTAKSSSADEDVTFAYGGQGEGKPKRRSVKDKSHYN